jgi:hypothetical protein
LTFPISKIRELEEGALMPVTDSLDLNGKKIHYWYKDHRLNLDGKEYTFDYFMQFDALDVVDGGDHGQRKFRMLMRLIYRNKSDTNVPVLMHTIKVGHIDCAKDTQKILERTIAQPINKGLRKVFGIVLVISRSTHSIAFINENPVTNGNFDEHHISLPIYVFITGDLAFMSTLLGKENMSTAWCPWCMLSKVQWGQRNHEPGELWTIDRIVAIRDRVEQQQLLEIPEHIKGCTKKPLFDSIPIEKYVVPVLHILIGVGNALVNSVFEFVDERIERLPEELIISRNNMITAEINLEDATEDYNNWLQNDGILLTECMIEKSNIIQQLKTHNEDGSFVSSGVEKRNMSARKKELNMTAKQLQIVKKEKSQRVEGLKRILQAMNEATKETEKSIGKVE